MEFQRKWQHLCNKYVFQIVNNMDPDPEELLSNMMKRAEERAFTAGQTGPIDNASKYLTRQSHTFLKTRMPTKNV